MDIWRIQTTYTVALQPRLFSEPLEQVFHLFNTIFSALFTCQWPIDSPSYMHINTQIQMKIWACNWALFYCLGSLNKEDARLSTSQETEYQKQHHGTSEAIRDGASGKYTLVRSPVHRSVSIIICPLFAICCITHNNYYLQVHMQTQLQRNLDTRLLVSNVYVFDRVRYDAKS